MKEYLLNLGQGNHSTNLLRRSLRDSCARSRTEEMQALRRSSEEAGGKLGQLTSLRFTSFTSLMLVKGVKQTLVVISNLLFHLIWEEVRNSPFFRDILSFLCWKRVGDWGLGVVSGRAMCASTAVGWIRSPTGGQADDPELIWHLPAFWKRKFIIKKTQVPLKGGIIMLVSGKVDAFIDGFKNKNSFM